MKWLLSWLWPTQGEAEDPSDSESATSQFAWAPQLVEQMASEWPRIIERYCAARVSGECEPGDLFHATYDAELSSGAIITTRVLIEETNEAYDVLRAMLDAPKNEGWD